MAQQLTPDIVAAEDLPAETPEHIRQLAREFARVYPDAIFDAEPMDYNVGWALAVMSEHFDGFEEGEPYKMAWDLAQRVLTDEQIYVTSIWPVGKCEFEQLQGGDRADT